MIPWDEIDWQDLEEAAGEFDGVRKNLKKLQLTISLGVRDGFLLFAIGSSTDGLKQLGGAGPRLSSRPELKPLLRAAGKRLTGISYSSKALAALSHTTAESLDNLATQAGTRPRRPRRAGGQTQGHYERRGRIGQRSQEKHHSPRSVAELLLSERTRIRGVRLSVWRFSGSR